MGDGQKELGSTMFPNKKKKIVKFLGLQNILHFQSLEKILAEMIEYLSYEQLAKKA